MVTKTFDDIFEAQEANHMFLRAQRVLASERAPLAPAPLNLLGVPYFGFSLVRDLVQNCGCVSAGGSRKRSSFVDAGGSKGTKDGDVTNSKWWREWKRKQRNNASSDVYTFVARHDDMVVEGGRWRSRLAQHIQRHVAELENETYLMREQLGGKIESMADKLDALSRGLNHKVISTHADRRTDTSNAGGGGGMGRRKFSLSSPPPSSRKQRSNERKSRASSREMGSGEFTLSHGESNLSLGEGSRGGLASLALPLSARRGQPLSPVRAKNRFPLPGRDDSGGADDDGPALAEDSMATSLAEGSLASLAEGSHESRSGVDPGSSRALSLPGSFVHMPSEISSQTLAEDSTAERERMLRRYAGAGLRTSCRGGAARGAEAPAPMAGGAYGHGISRVQARVRGNLERRRHAERVRNAEFNFLDAKAARIQACLRGRAVRRGFVQKVNEASQAADAVRKLSIVGPPAAAPDLVAEIGGFADGAKGKQSSRRSSIEMRI